MSPRWQCSYHNGKGTQCSEAAKYRLHFASDHPFDHVDVCAEHLDEYKGYCRLQDLGELNDTGVNKSFTFS